MKFNFGDLFKSILGNAAQGAVQGIQSQGNVAPGTINWASVGIVSLFGALIGIAQGLAPHPAVVAAQPAATVVVPPKS